MKKSSLIRKRQRKIYQALRAQRKNDRDLGERLWFEVQELTKKIKMHPKKLPNDRDKW